MRLLGKASARNKMISESDLRIMSILALDILSKRNVSTKYTTVRMLLISTSKYYHFAPVCLEMKDLTLVWCRMKGLSHE